MRDWNVGHRAPSVEADLWAAVLYAGPGAMLSHATALWWRGLLDKQPWPLQVTTPRRCRSVGGIRIDGRRSCERILHKRLPATSLEQALLDFAAVAPPERLRHVLANADYHNVLDIRPTTSTYASRASWSMPFGAGAGRGRPAAGASPASMSACRITHASRSRPAPAATAA
jgi:hypothetical protein